MREQGYKEFGEAHLSREPREGFNTLSAGLFNTLVLKSYHTHIGLLNKLSRNLVDENQVIVVENLALRNMVKNSKLAKSISDAGWGQFCTMLKYKCEWEGKIYIEVDRFFPSSKTCHHCLHQVDSPPLDIRNWECPSCGTEHDRDVNAAKNIRDEGLRILRVRNFEVSSKCKTQRTAEMSEETSDIASSSRQAVGRIATASGQRVRPSKGTAFSGIAG